MLCYVVVVGAVMCRGNRKTTVVNSLRRYLGNSYSVCSREGRVRVMVHEMELSSMTLEVGRSIPLDVLIISQGGFQSQSAHICRL